jgi:MoaA/NifB/PqqE/SkfB family radical SAM enzyme
MSRRNAGPVDAVVALSYRCNLRCATCDLADHVGEERLTRDTLRKLPSSLDYVNVTGGEPLLVKDIVPAVRAIYEATSARITISTNGTLPDRAEETVRELRRDVPGLHVSVSLDGLEETHDRIRRSPGSFRRALDTVDRLTPLLGRDLHLAFTISADNAGEFDGVAGLADEYGLPLSLALTHTSEHYFRPDEAAVPDEEAALRAVDAAARYYLRQPPPGGAGRAYFAAGLRCLVTSGRRPLACRAADRFFYLDPAGDVFGCNMRAEILGNLADAGFDEIWEGRPRAEFLPTAGSACPAQCWMVCTARTSILDHPMKTACWGLRAYGGRLLGLSPPPLKPDRR